MGEGNRNQKLRDRIDVPALVIYLVGGLAGLVFAWLLVVIIWA